MERRKLESLEFKGLVDSLDTEDGKISEKEVFLSLRQDKYNTCLCIGDFHISLSKIGYGLVKLDD